MSCVSSALAFPHFTPDRLLDVKGKKTEEGRDGGSKEEQGERGSGVGAQMREMIAGGKGEVKA